MMVYIVVDTSLSRSVCNIMFLYLCSYFSKEVYDEHEAIFEMKPMEALSVTQTDFKMEGFKSVPYPPVMVRPEHKTLII